MIDVVVAGAGITGLVAARDLARAGLQVLILEPDRAGGKLQTTPFDGGLLDEAADAFLARVPEALELCRELGLDGELVSPAARNAHVWSRGALRPLPAGQVLGVPTDLDELAASGILSPEGLDQARAEVDRPLVAPDDDPAIGRFFAERFGSEVVERLIDPLVGGINAGDTAQLSLAAVVPQLDAAVRSGASSVVEACRAQRAAVADPTAPVFYAPAGGMGAIVAGLVADLERHAVQVSSAALQRVEPVGSGWRVRTVEQQVDARAVVLATPAGPAAVAVRDVAPKAATLLAGIPYASVALVALAVPRGAIDRELDGSGFLVPAVEGRTVTACSWTSAKWPHQHGDGTVWLRASVGRDGRAPIDDDEALTAVVLADLADTMALRGPVEDQRITRWPGSFPQYRPGHLRRIDAIDADLAASAPGVVVAGAALRGLGVPACIRQARGAVARVLLHLG